MMRTVNKNGVHIEQCEGCRGVFLDRGELEQIANAESAYYAAPPAAYRPDSPRPYRGQPAHGGYYEDSPRPHRGGGYYADSPRHYRGHRRRSFLEGLFD